MDRKVITRNAQKTVSAELISRLINQSKRGNGVPIRILGTGMYLKYTSSIDNIERCVVYTSNPANSKIYTGVRLSIDSDNPYEIGGYDRFVKLAKKHCGVCILYKNTPIKTDWWHSLLNAFNVCLLPDNTFES